MTNNDKKITTIIKKLTNYIAKNGYYENLGDKEYRKFKDCISLQDINYQEKCRLLEKLEKGIENL